ncbi:hypothetical protein ANTRET_LOCUS11019 [Anthophora retusa]
MEKDVLENFLDGLPDRIAWRTSTLDVKIQTLEDAFDAVLQVDQRLRNRRQHLSEENSRWENNRRPRVAYPQSPSPNRQRFRNRSTSASDSDHEERPRRTQAFPLRRSPSPDVHRPRTMEKFNKEKIYCWNCGTRGHDGKICKERERKEFKARNGMTRNSHENNLNYNRVRHTGEMTDDRLPLRRTVRFADEIRGGSSWKHQQPESESRSRN